MSIENTYRREYNIEGPGGVGAIGAPSVSALRPFIVNPDKVVTFKRIAAKAGQTDLSWRSFLSQIITKGTATTALSTAQRMINGQMVDFSDLDVPEDIELTFNAYPSLEQKISVGRPLGNVLKKVPWFQKAAAVLNTVSAGAEALNKVAGNDEAQANNGSASAFMPYLIDMPAYDAESPTTVSWSSTFSFVMGQYGLWNAKKEVVLPVVNLMAPTFLRYITPMMQQGPFPTVYDLTARLLGSMIGNIKDGTAGDTFSGLGDRISGAFNEEGNIISGGIAAVSTAVEAVASLLEEIALDSYDGYIYDISYGRMMSFHNVFITQGKLEFPSNEVDQYGFPIAANVTLSFTTLAPASLSSSSNNSMVVRFGENGNLGNRKSRI